MSYIVLNIGWGKGLSLASTKALHQASILMILMNNTLKNTPGPILLAWINLNPNMDTQLHPL